MHGHAHAQSLPPDEDSVSAVRAVPQCADECHRGQSPRQCAWHFARSPAHPQGSYGGQNPSPPSPSTDFRCGCRTPDSSFPVGRPLPANRRRKSRHHLLALSRQEKIPCAGHGIRYRTPSRAMLSVRRRAEALREDDGCSDALHPDGMGCRSRQMPAAGDPHRYPYRVRERQSHDSDIPPRVPGAVYLTRLPPPRGAGLLLRRA